MVLSLIQPGSSTNIYDLGSSMDIVYNTNTLLSRFDSQELSAATVSVNSNINDSSLNEEDNPALAERYRNGGELSEAEVASVLYENDISPTEAIALSNSPEGLPTLLGKFDLYFSDTLTPTAVKTLCSIVPNIRDSLSNLSDAIKDGVEAVTSIFEGEGDGLSSLKEAVKLAIESIIDGIKAVAYAIIQGIKETVKGLMMVSGAVFLAIKDHVENVIEEVEEFFDELSVEKLKQSFEDLITGASRFFEDVTGNIQDLLSLKICETLSETEKELQKPVERLKKTQDSLEESQRVMTPHTEQAIVESAAAGRDVPEEPDRQRVIVERAEAAIERSPERAAQIIIPENQEIGKVPYENDHIDFSSVRDQVLRGNSGPILNPITGEQIITPGYRGLKADITQKAKKIHVALVNSGYAIPNSKFKVNSGFRSVEYNKYLYELKYGQRAINSLHSSGIALDISTNGWDEELLKGFLLAAVRASIGGIGIYNTFLHIDTGRERYWNRSSSGKSYLVSYLQSIR